MDHCSESIDTAVLNNLMETQLQMNDEDEDFRIIENLLFADHERTYNKLDCKTSRKVFQAVAKVEPRPEKIQCSHCEEVFTSNDFRMHVCLFDENHLLIPIAKSVKDETEFETLARCMTEQLKKNQSDIKDLTAKLSDPKSSSAVESSCFKCCRKFVHESGLSRHWERHIGELLELSPPENLEQVVSVSLCVICGQVFGLESEGWNHLQSHHVTVIDGNNAIKVQKSCVRKVSSQTSEYEPPKKIMKLRSSKNVPEKDSVTMDIDESDSPKPGGSKSANTNKEVKQDEVYITDVQIKTFLKPIHVSKVFQCEFCDSIFINLKTMRFHVSKHSPSDAFQCGKCELKSLNLKEILLHRRIECIEFRDFRNPLKDFPRVWVCNVCEDEFRGLEQLLEHRYSNQHFFPRIELLTGTLLFSCERCSIEFSHAPSLVEHFSDKHQKKAKSEAVAETSERIPKAPTEASRGGIHQTSTRPRQYLCEVCGKSYTQSSHLWQHLRFHQGVKPFGCSVEGCGRRFTIRPDLNDHVRKCHTGERPYLCIICGKRFLTGSVFYQHRLIHRGERRYGCEECKKRFYRADALKNHLRIHTGEKPHSCSECGKKFRQRGDRDKHVKARHPNAVVISSPRKTRVKSFGRGRVRNNTSLYRSKPDEPDSRIPQTSSL